jgi:hypothetical protein
MHHDRLVLPRLDQRPHLKNSAFKSHSFLYT